MKFFQKRWVAITLCAVMIVVSLAIGRAKTVKGSYNPSSDSAAESWGEENYSAYTRYVQDETGVLKEKTIRMISEQNAALDYSYGSICGVAIVDDGIASSKMEDEAFRLGYDLGLGESDVLLLLDTKSQDYYFAYGEDMAYYVDNSLEILVTGAMSHVFDRPEEALTELFDQLAGWYAKNVPVTGEPAKGGSIGKNIVGTIFFVLLLAILIVIAVVSSLIRAGRNVIWRAGGWMPLLFLNRRHGPGPRPGPQPGPGPRPGPGSGTARRSNRSAGGFGGSSRGSFKGGGGFGGSNRGGGFGGKR